MPLNKWLVLLLVLSLGANLAMAGFLAGRAAGDGGGPRLLDPNLRVTRMLLQQLPEERREALRPLVRDQFRSIRPSVGGIREAQRDIEAALVAEPFDPEKLEEALGAFRTHLSRSQETSHAAFVGLARSLSPEERRLLGRALEGSGRHRPHGHPPPGMPAERP
jgi:uncharacterized membrane protein